MADGSVRIDVGLDTRKAEKDLGKLKDKIAKAETALNSQAETRNGLEEKLNAATAAAEETKKVIEELNAYIEESEKSWRGEEGAKEIRGEAFFGLKDTIEEAKGYLVEEEKSLREQEKSIAVIKREFEKVNKQYETGTKNLEEMKTQAGELAQIIEETEPDEEFEDVGEETEKASNSLTGFIKKALGITSVVVLFKKLASAISSSLKEYADYDDQLRLNMATMQATAKAMRVTIGSGLAAAYNAVLPIVQRIANWMLQAANAASRFIAIVSGQGSYKRAVVNTAEVAQSLEDTTDELEDTSEAADDVADSAREARKQLMGFDELNILAGDDTGGAGGGSGKTGKNKTKKENPILDGIELIDEAIDKIDGSLLDKLAFNIKDVLFDWDDLNPEQIAKKIIAGLGAVLGAALGIALGLGPGGVLMMTIAGLVLALIADSLIFDNDGKISKGEILDMVMMAIGAITGGILGAKAGPKGALIGIWIGAALGLTVSKLLFDHDGKLSNTELMNMIITVLGGIAGAVIGSFFPIPGGTLIGFAVGAGLTLLIQSIKPKLEGTKIGNFLEMLVGMLTMIGGGAIGFKIGAAAGTALGGPVGAVIGAVVGLGLTFLVKSIRLSLASHEAAEADWHNSAFGKQVDALKEEIQKSLDIDADVRVHINSITGEVDESTMADFAAAQQLIDSIFTLDGKENLTTEEATLLQQQIEALNSLGLAGIQLAFDETTGHVKGTRQEIQGLLDDLLKQYQVEAMKEAYMESFKAQYESTEEVRRATDNAKASAENYTTAQENLARAQEEYNSALQDYQQYAGEIQSAGSGGAISEEAQLAAARLENAAAAVESAKIGVTETKAVAEEAKTALETALETSDLAAEKVTSIGDSLVDLIGKGSESGAGMTEGFTDEVEAGTPAAAEATKTMGQEALDALTEVLDEHSPSKETAKRGKWAVEGFEEGIKEETPKAVLEVRNMMDLIYQEFATNLERIKGLMNFSWSLPRPRIPQIGWNFRTVSYGRGQSVSIPQFFVNWYARGGVFDNPALIGVGESGKEAVVPLEKNTEWMRTVADGIMERLTQANFASQLATAFASVPMPAMAGGGIVPPRAMQAGFSADGLEESIRRGMVDALMAMGSTSKKGGLVININGREFMRATYDDLKAVENEHGISMIET